MKPLVLILPAILLTGCTAVNSSSKDSKHQMELTLHKVRTDVEDLRHDLNTYEIEHHVLEGKLIDQERIITTLKAKLSDGNKGKLEQDIDTLNKKLHQLTKEQEKVLTDIRKLSSHANDTTTALGQFRDKISLYEKTLDTQKEHLLEVKKLRENLASLTREIYIVKSGDSLEKIAKTHNMTVDALKRANNLSKDLIVVGQELKLP